MEIGLNIFCCGAITKDSLEHQISLMSKYGFTKTFGVSDKEELTDDVIKKIQDSKISFETLHLPFKGINAIYSTSEEAEEMYKKITDGIEKCSRHEIPIGVLHLSSGKNPPINDIGLERFDKIMNRASELGVKIAFENLRTLGNISLAFEKYDNAMFCWDTGHENVFTPGRQYMPLFGKKLITVHLHDNHGIYDKDDHMIPYDGCINFDRVAMQLAEANYNGTLMLEIVKERDDMYSAMSNEEYIKRASNAVSRLKEQIVKFKAKKN